MIVPGELLKPYGGVLFGDERMDKLVEQIVRDCADVALAIDSGRGNEKEINRAILSRYGLQAQTAEAGK